MASNPLFYQLLLVALVLLCLLVHVEVPDVPPRVPQTPLEPKPHRRQARGPAPKPRWMPLPELLYAQVVKTMRRRCLVEVKHRMVFGTQAAAGDGDRTAQRDAV
jgi:hypothetical protein